ncbi:MAG: TRCF domain-containing protein, partial [Acidimicrobiales bacterium]
VKLDLPVQANLPPGYVAREDLRLEAYRRLSTVATQAEVDDIRAEWLDRYGPLPPPAEALLAVGRLRAECVRTGVREVNVARDVVRIAPLRLKTSQTIRLRRLFPKAVYKEDLGQLVVPIVRGADPVEAALTLLTTLVPEEERLPSAAP